MTSHITKDQSEARKAEVPETEALKPCPFCGGKCDPEGWIGDKKRSGPACDDCGSAAETVAIWNARAAELSAQDADTTVYGVRVGHVGNDGIVVLHSYRANDSERIISTQHNVREGDVVIVHYSAQDASPKDGWKLVPVEMTAWMRKFSGINEWRWKAALDAAPQQEPK